MTTSPFESKYTAEYSTSDYFTKMWYPRRDFDDTLADLGRLYFEGWNKKLKLPIYFRCSSPLKYGVKGLYIAWWRQIDKNDPFGEILIDVEHHDSQEDLYETIRHELAHAVVDLRYKKSDGHGQIWKRVAKLMRVNTKQYE